MWKLQLLSERALFHTLDRKIKFDNICAWQMLSISKLVLNDGLILRTFMSMSMKRKQAWTEVFGSVRTSPIGRFFFPPASQQASWEVAIAHPPRSHSDDSCITYWPSGKSPCVSWGRGLFSWWQWNRWDKPLHLALRLLAAIGCQEQHLRKQVEAVLLC